MLTAASGVGQQAVKASAAYNPVSSGATAATITYLWDNIQHTLTTARGSVKLDIASGGIPRWTFEMTGTYADPRDSFLNNPDYSDFTDPEVPRNTVTTVSIGGQSNIPVTAFSFDCGNNVVVREPLNIAQSIEVTDRAPSASLTIDAQNAGLFNPVKLARDGSTIAVELTHGTVAGKKLKVTLGKCQVGQGVAYADDNGILQHTLPLTVLPASASGNDDVIFTVGG